MKSIKNTVLILSICLLLTACTNTLPAVDEVAEETSDGAVVLEKLEMASGNPENINDVFEQLIGTWYLNTENYPEPAKQWMKDNGISDFYDSFEWGTNKAWIDFGDYRVVNGEPVKTGVGMISWHTGLKHARFRESGSRGGFVDGMLEIRDENTIVRHFEFFSPEGEVRYQSDVWSFDPRNKKCFLWQTTRYQNGLAEEQAAREFCKRS